MDRELLGFTSPFMDERKDLTTVNVFRKCTYLLTCYLSMCCKTYCLTFQKQLFCTVKQALLHCKTAALAMPKRSYHF
ncbi:hypothetical protein CBG57_02145 [Prevotella nigrescens]|nr:hypothetical protein CBG57_02145 [Prevotella nigrescens]